MQWDIQNPDWEGNPFDVRAQVEFKHAASGEVRRTEMFYNGESIWSFRFTATKPGTWTLQTSSADQHLDGHLGTIHIAANPNKNAHGFIQNIHGKWGWEGTETPFVPQLVMWDYVATNRPLREWAAANNWLAPTLKTFLTEHGFDGVHLPVIGGRWFDRDAESDQVIATMESPDPRTFAALETLIVKTHAAGGMVHLWAWGDHQRRQTPRSLKPRWANRSAFATIHRRAVGAGVWGMALIWTNGSLPMNCERGETPCMALWAGTISSAGVPRDRIWV
ncbi:MAG: DUF5060 domain-containing protein [Planctomycetaceae bacterium]|nr:DUF5060 domain-containing protein [Planctomycetaceae bacterium]